MIGLNVVGFRTWADVSGIGAESTSAAAAFLNDGGLNAERSSSNLRNSVADVKIAATAAHKTTKRLKRNAPDQWAPLQTKVVSIGASPLWTKLNPIEWGPSHGT